MGGVSTALMAQVPLSQLANVARGRRPQMGVKTSEGAVPNAWIYWDDAGFGHRYVWRSANGVIGGSDSGAGKSSCHTAIGIFWSGQYEYMLRAPGAAHDRGAGSRC